MYMFLFVCEVPLKRIIFDKVQVKAVFTVVGIKVE